MEEVRFGPAHDCIRWYASGRELTILDGRSGVAVVLNEPGAAIFHACDGSRSLQQVVEHVSVLSGVPPQDLTGDVAQLVDALVEQGFLRGDPPAQR